MKKILILGAGEFQVPLIEKAKEMELYTIVVSPKGPFPGIDLADKLIFLDIREKEEILKIAQKEGIDGVTTDQADLPVRTAAYIAERLGLPGIGYETALLFTDKYLMREKCNSVGIPTAKYIRVDEAGPAKYFCRQIGYPAILKPVDNQGSRGVYRVNNDSDVEKYFKIAQVFSSDNMVLIEEFIDGYEYVIESMAFDNHIRNLIIGDTQYFKLNGRFFPRQRLFPAINNPGTISRTLELNKKIIKTFGLNQGITHGEYVIDKKTKEIYLLEIGARGGGAYTSSNIIPLLTTLDANRFLLNIALGSHGNAEIHNIGNAAAGYIAFYLPDGIITSIEGLEKVEKMDGVEKHNLDSIIKNQPSSFPENKAFRKIIVVRSASREKLDILIEEIKSAINIKVKTSKGLKDIIWD